MRVLWNVYKRFVFVFALLVASTAWSADALAASLRLTWDDTSTNEDGFRVERLIAGLVDATIDLGSNTNSYTDAGLTSGTVYCYRVLAFNSGGTSAPSNQACATAQDVVAVPATVTVSLASAAVGGTVTITWSGINAPTATDWVGVYLPSAADTNFLDWIYVSCSRTAATAKSSGSCSYALPSTMSPGTYELRLFANDGFARLGTSSVFSVSSTVPNPTVNVSPTSIGVGGTVTASWSGIVSPSATDWLGLYVPNASDANKLDWIYVSCSKTAAIAKGSGSCSYVLPSSLAAGTYELRLFGNDSLTRLTKSNTFTVNPISVTPTVSVSPTTIGLGGTVAVSWTGIAAPTAADWIGLFAPAATNKKFIDRFYVGCLATPTTARAAGSCAFTLPKRFSAGTYEFRLFANNSYTKLATSNPLTVSKSTNVTLLSDATTQSSTESSSTTSLVDPMAVFAAPAGTNSHWTDYRVALKLRSSSQNTVGFMFRYQDNDNFYRFSWNRQTKSRQLEKVENGVLTVLARDSVSYVIGRTYNVEFIAQGTLLSVKIDGAQVFSVQDSSFSGGTIALYSAANQGSIFDDVVVEDLATGGLLLSSDFNDATLKGWTIVDQTPNQVSSVWSAATGSLIQSSTNSGTFALYTARNWADYRLTTKLKSLDTRPVGLLFRYQDSKNHYRFSWDAQNKSRRLEKVNNGTVTILVSDVTPYVTGRAYSLDIVARGTLLEVRIDGMAVFSVADAAFSQGTVALYSLNNDATSFDDVLVQDFASGAVLLAEDFNDGNFPGWTTFGSWSVQSGVFSSSDVNRDVESVAIYTY